MEREAEECRRGKMMRKGPGRKDEKKNGENARRGNGNYGWREAGGEIK